MFLVTGEGAEWHRHGDREGGTRGNGIIPGDALRGEESEEGGSEEGEGRGRRRGEG